MSWMKKYKKKFDVFKVILDKSNPIIVEIGAHYGEDSVRFVETFKDAKVFCFEPDPRNIAIFKKHVDDESFQDYEKPEVPEKYDWISYEDYQKHKLNNSGSSSLKKGYEHNLNETITVKTRRFDNWIVENDLTGIDLAWIDVQGAESMVIEGMSSEITNINFIWIEYGETAYDGGLSRMETIALLNSKGFKILKDFNNDTHTGDLLFYNVHRN